MKITRRLKQKLRSFLLKKSYCTPQVFVYETDVAKAKPCVSKTVLIGPKTGSTKTVFIENLEDMIALFGQ